MRGTTPINLVLAALAITMFGCKEKGPSSAQGRGAGKQTMSVSKESFGQTPEGRQVDLYTLARAGGMKARIINYGAILVSLEVPDRNGKLADVTLGYDRLDDYLKRGGLFGAVVGRYANRIGGAKFVLDGVEYPLAPNNRPNHIHGGRKGFDKAVWMLEDLKADDHQAAVKLSYVSQDGEEGYPGNLACSVT